MSQREIKTEPVSIEDARARFEAFLAHYTREGCALRMEHVTGLEGTRFVLVFSWDDMG